MKVKKKKELYESGKNEVDGCQEIALSSGSCLGTFHNLFNYLLIYQHTFPW